MCTRLSVNISSIKQAQQLQVDFFASEEWTPETEVLLIQKMQDILNLVRGKCQTLKINLDIDVADAEETISLLRRHLRQKESRIIHNQKLSIREIEILGY